MSVGDVVGPQRRPSWSYYLTATNSPEPTWNFKGQFLVSRTGRVSVPTSDLEGDIARLLDEKEEEEGEL
jgi:hypothetical protein